MRDDTALWPRSDDTVTPVRWAMVGRDREKKIHRDTITRDFQRLARIGFSEWQTQSGLDGLAQALGVAVRESARS